MSIFMIAAAVVGALLVMFMIMLRVVVPTNTIHIVQSRKRTIAYGKGCTDGNVYYKWPSKLPRIGVVVSTFPSSNFDVSLNNYEAYDVGRLPFVVDIMAFFRVSDPLIASQRIHTFGELMVQLNSVLQGSVRRILSTNNLEHIMQDRSALGKQFTEEVDSQLQEWGVSSVKSIEFMNIQDSSGSKVIANIMAKEQSRIDRESRQVVAGNKQAAAMTEIDADRSIEVQRQDAIQQVETRKAEVQKHVGIQNEIAKQAVAVENAVTAERKAAVAQVEAVRASEIARDVAVVNAEAQQRTLLINAEAQKMVTLTNAGAQKESTVLIAEGVLQSTLKEAEGIKATGLAKAETEAALLMAPVTAQTNLAKEIGANESYQQYLITVRKVEADQAIGVEMARTMSTADIKIIANGGDVAGGMNSIQKIMGSGTGTSLGGLISGLMNNPDAAKVLSNLSK